MQILSGQAAEVNHCVNSRTALAGLHPFWSYIDYRSSQPDYDRRVTTGAVENPNYPEIWNGFVGNNADQKGRFVASASLRRTNWVRARQQPAEDQKL